MKKTLLSLCLALCFASACAQQSADSLYIREHYTKMEKYITMRDGKKLFCSIYLPKDQTQKYPIMMTRTPYTVAPYGANEFKKALGQNMLLAREGYIFVYEDVRGRWMSEGDFVDVRPQIDHKKGNTDIDESTDTYDTIDWLVKNQPNNNGRVGIEGISYPGFYSTASLPNAHPALKAVSPQAPVTDWFIGDDFHHNGAFFQMDAFAFLTSFGVPRPKPITPAEFNNAVKYTQKDNYKFYLDLGALPNFKKKYLGDSVKFWNNMMDHPNYDAFWQGMNIRPHLTNIKPATMVVGGFFDAEDCFGALRTYDALEKQNPQSHKNMLVMGPWFHGGWERGDGDYFGDQDFGQKTSAWFRENIELPFFNYYLKDKGAMDLPEATIFITGSNQWKKFNTWPPKNTTEKTLYLQADGKLSFTPSKSANSFDEYVSDPNTPVPYQDGIQERRTREYMIDDQRFASRRPDVKTYQTDALTEDITLTGPVMADLFSSTTGTDADYVVKLIDVFPDDYPAPVPNPKNITLAGYQMLVRGEIFRGRYRNSFVKPEAFVPGQITEIKYNLPDVAHTFRKGHRMMIQVQSSWFPLADRNPQKFIDIYKAKDSDFQKATIRIYHDDTALSNVKVTILQ
ncbi:CocE/NonD family hydrolase [Mucilaginibacter paludis]|uniref:Hydrolase CocE/NonD family protein n=1 Tax=Mucilaginibacter paludis DSM 18603 TaxID=714943 RepID=H1XZJ2_9SPHI|nr:CocE/NonD family hydrolase [Mucilaginibacter paludis]EHQ26636.1 hydrolase CocE/NonD family protein [Mucilaginibacter paludis DSM 18603]